MSEDLSQQTCLVTGGAGFIGVAASGGLARRFGSVVALDCLLPQVHNQPHRPADLDPAVRLVQGDVCDPEVWDGLLAEVRPDVVLHLAAETGTGQSLRQSTLHTAANVVGTSQMLDAFVRHDALPSRVILTSSRAVYGEGAWRSLSDGSVFYPGQRKIDDLEAGRWDFPDAQPLPMSATTTTPQPVSVYAVTKLTQEHLLGVWAAAFGVDLAVLRLQNVYGPGQSLSNPYTGIMSLFCRLARSGQAIPLYEDGEIRRDFVLIDDVAQALLAVIDRPAANGHTIDIGSGRIQTIRTAAEAIATHYGAPYPVVTGQYRLGDVRHAWADPTQASQLLNWRAGYDLDEGVARLAKWIESQL
ncbi:MAG: NAD-dependent epimerase/dehydratase family protein [Propionibacteriaceae bacterium]|jgi:dTDP-L-rhamnose 4-epimerase|nr:NAD-dependent epimerase/dehydratase family protein [Propionibacteriaceae bacterium]